MNEKHNKHNVYFMGRMGGNGFLFYSNVPVKTPYSDFQGLKYGFTGTMYNSFAKKLGIVPVMVTPNETYTALERGMIDGHGASGWGVVALGYHEVVNYRIDHRFWGRGGSTTMINLDTWNNLPKHLQDLLRDEWFDTEDKVGGGYVEEKVEDERSKLIDFGVQMITFSPTDANWYVNLAHEAKWEELMEAAPESYSILREMLRK